MAKDLRELLEGVFDGYSKLVHEPFKANPTRKGFTDRAVDLVRSSLGREDLLVSASMGQGNWADVPWIGIFNPENTTTATDGLYVVYLYSSVSQRW